MLNIIFSALFCLLPPDSLRMETINGKPFVVHQVGEKETLYSISRRYGATVAAILEQNPTADGGLEIGQILKVPYAPKPKAQAVQTSDGVVHKVAAKETLFSIARQYNVSVDDIKLWNNLKDGSLSVGQDILIKKTAVASTAVEIKPQPTGAKTHTVATKETLYSIARQYGMTVQQLKEWNGIQENELKVGQVIAVAAPAVTTTVTPAVTSSVAAVGSSGKTQSTITVSEGVTGSDEVREIGMAGLIEGTEGNRKYLAQHRTIKPGTILKIRNLSNNQEVFVRVTDPAPFAVDAPVIRISRSAYDRLGAEESTFRAEITYYK